MIDRVLAQFGAPCRGGFVAYYHDSALYPSDPAAMFTRAVAVLIAADGTLYICPADLSRPDAPQDFDLQPIPKTNFGSRATGALFARGCYFSIDEGPFAGAYQISDDRVACTQFPTPRAYRRFLLGK